MKQNKFSSQMIKAGLGAITAVALTPAGAHACACGCGVFEVGTSSMFPQSQGLMAYFNLDFQDQNRNWDGFSKAPAADNDDKKLETYFTSIGVQYMFNDKWGVEAELPYDFRHFKGTDEEGNVRTRGWSQVGDLRLNAIYTGFKPDLSAGLTLGVKLPTGSYSFDTDLVDRDTQIGTGSTDVLLGGFYRGHLDEVHDWEWFGQFQLEVPVLTQAGYHPGTELDAAVGVDYSGFRLGRAKISPVTQAIVSERTSDTGSAADSQNTGYQRLLLSPGIEVHIHPFRFYADAEFPVLQHFTGDQLSAVVLFKCSISVMF